MRQTYGKELYKHARSYAVWLPGSPAALGDYGIIKEGCFERIGSIHDLLPGFTVAETTSELDAFSFLSEGVAEARAKAGGKLMKVNYSVSANSGVVFYAKGLAIRSVSNLVKLSKHLSTDKKWDHSWQIVTSVTSASDFYVLIGGRAGTKFSVTAEADAFPLLQVPLTNASAGFRVEGECALHLAGKSGPVMVNLHRMKLFGNGLKFAAPNQAATEEPSLVPCTDEPSE